MHLTRAESTKRLPIERKTTKYVARALSHKDESVPVVIAIRDMLKLAKTNKEVKHIIKEKLLKINGKNVKDFKESIRLFNVLSVGDKNYKLSILPSGRFFFEETKENYRIAKVIGKTILKKGFVQLSLHDGTNILGDKKIKIGDSLELDFSQGIRKTIELDKGRKVFVFSGKSAGKNGKIEEIVDSKARIEFENRSVELNKSHLIAVN